MLMRQRLALRALLLVTQHIVNAKCAMKCGKYLPRSLNTGRQCAMTVIGHLLDETKYFLSMKPT